MRHKEKRVPKANAEIPQQKKIQLTMRSLKKN